MYVGVDIGGTKIAAGLVSRDGKILRKLEVPTKKGKEQILAHLRKMIRMVSAGQEIHGVGIGVPGTFKGTKIIDLPNLQDLSGVDLNKELNFNVPVVLQNDARCFVLGEQHFGKGQGNPTVIGITIGTSLGTGLVLDGSLYTGSHGYAGEISRVFANPKDVLIGKLPFFWGDFGGEYIHWLHKKNGGKAERASDVWKLGSPAAKKTQKEVAQFLAMHVANLVNIFDPDMIVFGGGIANEKLIAHIRKFTDGYLKVIPKESRPRIELSENPVDSGIRGAVLSVRG
ncbi:ROK family protein [Candidatus Woesearchaeota archaeon]|nr:ROK family protein [Candidatus Woesearchaeota archaeon]